MLPHVPLDEALLSLLPDIYRTVRVHISPAHELSTCGELDPRDSLITRASRPPTCVGVPTLHASHGAYSLGAAHATSLCSQTFYHARLDCTCMIRLHTARHTSHDSTKAVKTLSSLCVLL